MGMWLDCSYYARLNSGPLVPTRALARSLVEELEAKGAEVTSRWHKRTYTPPQDLGTCAIHDSEDIDPGGDS